MQLFISFNGQVVASSVIHKQRFYPENGGSSCCNVTIKDDTLIKLCADVLKKIGWIGFADFDLIEDPRDEVIKIMELNPRIPACIKSAIESGADYATLIADASLGFPLSIPIIFPGISYVISGLRYFGSYIVPTGLKLLQIGSGFGDAIYHSKTLVGVTLCHSSSEQ